MSIEKAIFSYLTNFPGVKDLIGTRLYPLEIPQTGTLPAVIYESMGRNSINSQSGDSNLAKSTIRFTAWAEDYDGERVIIDALDIALNGYQGMMGGLYIQGCFTRQAGEDLNVPTDLIGRVIEGDFWHGKR